MQNLMYAAILEYIASYIIYKERKTQPFFPGSSFYEKRRMIEVAITKFAPCNTRQPRHHYLDNLIVLQKTLVFHKLYELSNTGEFIIPVLMILLTYPRIQGISK